MGDLALVRKPNGRYGWMVRNGDVVRTGQPIPNGITADVAIDDGDPAILRLLMQGPWIADDGEREGTALPDVKIINAGTREVVQGIVERRLGKLITAGKLLSVTVQEVGTEGDAVWVRLSVVRPGKQPQPLRARLR